MANKQPAASKRARSTRDDQRDARRSASQNGDGEAAATFEQQLAHYLQERIKPGLNLGAIRLLARSLAKEVAHRRAGEDADAAGEPDEQEADDVRDEVDDDDVRGDAVDDFSDEKDENERSLEDEMRDLQANLGDDWVLRVSVQGEYAWLTAEKDDGSQYVEAPGADVLAEVVERLNESGGRRRAHARSTSRRERS
jgi:hypothetical protein